MTSCTSVSCPTHLDDSLRRRELSEKTRLKPPFERLEDEHEESKLNSLAKLSDALRSGIKEDGKLNRREQTNSGSEGIGSKGF